MSLWKKKCSASLGLEEMRTETLQSCHSSQVTVVMKKMRVWGENTYRWQKCNLVLPFGNQCGRFSKTNNRRLWKGVLPKAERETLFSNGVHSWPLAQVVTRASSLWKLRRPHPTPLLTQPPHFVLSSGVSISPAPEMPLISPSPSAFSLVLEIWCLFWPF